MGWAHEEEGGKEEERGNGLLMHALSLACLGGLGGSEPFPRYYKPRERKNRRTRDWACETGRLLNLPHPCVAIVFMGVEPHT